MTRNDQIVEAVVSLMQNLRTEIFQHGVVTTDIENRLSGNYNVVSEVERFIDGFVKIRCEIVQYREDLVKVRQEAQKAAYLAAYQHAMDNEYFSVERLRQMTLAELSDILRTD